MVDSSPRAAIAAADGQVPSRLRVLLLPEAKATERGILYRRGGRAYLLAWPRVRRAYGAVLAELRADSEDATTVLFDLAVASEGPVCTVCRVRAPAGEEASRVARALVVTLGSARCAAEIRAIAEESAPPRRWADEETFRDAVLESIRWDRACAENEPGGAWASPAPAG